MISGLVWLFACWLGVTTCVVVFFYGVCAVLFCVVLWFGVWVSLDDCGLLSLVLMFVWVFVV